MLGEENGVEVEGEKNFVEFKDLMKRMRRPE